MFRRVAWWFAGALLFSIVGYIATSTLISHSDPMRGLFFRQVMKYATEEAVVAWETRGSEGLREELSRQHRNFSEGRQHLLDAAGRDLLTGESLARELRETPVRRRLPWPAPAHFLIKQPSADGRYTLLVEAQAAEEPMAHRLAYLWLALLLLLFAAGLTRSMMRPVGELHHAVVRFGRGDLGTRARVDRSDEIGDLARAFNTMADRIETLLTAERRLLQDVSHELRSPLARLRFAVELARSSADPRAALGRVDKEVERLSAIVGELLQVTRAEGDPGSRNASTLDLAALVRSVAADCSAEAEARGCRIRVRAPENMKVNGDGDLLHRAVQNVVRNAVHHTASGDAVEVELCEHAGQSVLRVRDYGPGVPEGELEAIFRPFYRVEHDRNRTNGGVGLGLAIASRAVTAHNGAITARNAEPGLAVEITLPRAEAAGAVNNF